MKTPLHILKKYFGYDTFLPDQEILIQSVLECKDTLAVMPTGSGKSIIYQLPSLIFEGLTIVVSPLIALMKDQVRSLHINGIEASYINSLLSVKEADEILNKLENGSYRMLYISPEKLLTPDIINKIKSWNVSLFAIDEAHCISTWGHDFRPEYSKLGLLKKEFPKVPLVALTATADKVTRKDIIAQLALEEPTVRVASFDRPNLSLKVTSGINRFEIMENFISDRANSSGIIYCLSRKSTENLSKKLQEIGIRADYYHAGMDRQKRHEVQELFLKDEIQVICATIAFGMGIDKSNIRWIIHYNLPKSLENYYQEIGRAGRDGIKSDTLLFYSFRDVVMLREFAKNSGQPEIQMEKLGRMQQYAEASSCRRIVLLSYFNEHREKPCGNCDICQNPPETFDGSTIAQKALSAIVRLHEGVASGVLIDVLRGSSKREILEQGFHKIKTYGAGRTIGFFDWQQYLLQMLHLGLFDIAYDDNQKLQITDIGKKVLYEDKKIHFVRPVAYRSTQIKKQPRVKKLSKTEKIKQDLTELISAWRKQKAEAEALAPHLIFNDKTLAEMVEKRPVFFHELLEVNGISQSKAEKYSSDLLDLIKDFKIKHKDRNSSFLYSKKLLDEGNTINQIAEIRELNVGTVMQHLINYFELDPKFPIFKHIPPFDPVPITKYIHNYIIDNGEKPVNKIIFEQFKGQYEYHQIRIAYLVYLNQEN